MVEATEEAGRGLDADDVTAAQSPGGSPASPASSERKMAPGAERWRTALLAGVVFLSFAYFLQGGGMNENSRFDLVRAIVEGRTFVIDPYAVNTIDKSVRNGHFYSAQAPGLAFAATPPYALYHAFGPSAPSPPPYDRVALWWVTVAVIGVSSAFAAAVMYSLLRRLRLSPPWAATSVLAWCFGTNAFAYGTLFYSHQFVASLLFGSWAILFFVAHGRGSVSRRGYAFVAASGFFASWAAISEFPTAPVAALICAYGVLRLGPRRMAIFVGAAIPPLTLLAVYNRICFGSALSLSYQHLAVTDFQKVSATNFLGIGAPSLGTLNSLLFGEFRGLLPLAPFLAAAPYGAALFARDSRWRAEIGLCVSGPGVLLLLISGYVRWDGGAAMGPRYLVAMLPFLIVPTAYAIQALQASASRRIRLATGTLAGCVIAYSVAVCTMCVAVMPEFPDSPMPSPVKTLRPPDEFRPITTFALPLFFEGHIGEKAVFANGIMGFASFSPQHADDATNFGEGIGLRGPISLLPLFSLWALAGLTFVWLGRRHRPTAGPLESPEAAQGS
jgi:hypothetical protein